MSFLAPFGLWGLWRGGIQCGDKFSVQWPRKRGNDSNRRRNNRRREQLTWLTLSQGCAVSDEGHTKKKIKYLDPDGDQDIVNGPSSTLAGYILTSLDPEKGPL